MNGHQAPGLNGRVVRPWQDQVVRPWEDRPTSSQAAPSHPENSQNSPPDPASEPASRRDGSSPSEGRNPDSSPASSSSPFEKQIALPNLNISPAGDKQDTANSSSVLDKADQDGPADAFSPQILPSSNYQQVSANTEPSHLMNLNNYHPPGFPAAASSNGYNPLVPGYLPAPVSPHFMQAPAFSCATPTGLMPPLNPTFPTLIHKMPPTGYLMPPSSLPMPPALFPSYPVVSPSIMQQGLSANPQPKSENPQRTYKSQHDRFFTPAQRDVLESWYQANKQNAYAKKHSEMLANATGLSKAQVNKWLSNRRNRDNNTRQRSKPY